MVGTGEGEEKGARIAKVGTRHCCGRAATVAAAEAQGKRHETASVMRNA